MAAPSEDREVVTPVAGNPSTDTDSVQKLMDRVNKLLDKDEKGKNTTVSDVNNVVKKMDATFGLIKALTRGECDTLAVVRSMIGVVDLFTGVPLLPIVNTLVSIFYKPPSKPDPVLVKLDEIVNLINDLKMDIHNDLAKVMRVELDLHSFQEHTAEINLCFEKMLLFLDNKDKTSPLYEQSRGFFFQKADASESAMNKLIAMLKGGAGRTPFMDELYQDNYGYSIPVTNFAFLIHVNLMRGLACLQMYTIENSSQEYWEQCLPTLNEKIETCYTNINATLRRCRDEVGDNLKRDFLAGHRLNIELNDLWKSMMPNYDAIIDMRFLKVYFDPNSENGWLNTVIYHHRDVTYNYIKVTEDYGVFIFFWTTDNLETKQTSSQDSGLLVENLRAACVNASKKCSRKVPNYLTSRVNQFGLPDVLMWQYFAGLSMSNEWYRLGNLNCCIMVVNYVSGYRPLDLLLMSNNVNKLIMKDPWKFSEGASTNGSFSAKFSLEGVRVTQKFAMSYGQSHCLEGVRDTHNGIVCLVRRKIKNNDVQAYFSLGRDGSTGDINYAPVYEHIIANDEMVTFFDQPR